MTEEEKRKYKQFLLDELRKLQEQEIISNSSQSVGI
jgi:hypothetical protein